MDEQPLAGGNATAGVVRVGDTVRKPWQPSTPAVIDYVERIRAAGIDAPAHLGRDQRGRQIIEYVPGALAEALLPFDDTALRRVGEMVRAIHDASPVLDSSDAWPEMLLAPPGAAELICHNDLAPWNLIVGERWVFIDWDGAGPSTRLWDLAYAAQAFAVLNDAQPVDAAAARLAAFVDGYGADDELRRALPMAMVQRTAAMHRLLQTSHERGMEPWGTMHVDGHGAYWLGVTRYVAEHRDAWAAALGASPAHEAAARTPIDDGPFFHGTTAAMHPGDLLTAGHRSNYRPDVVMNHIYFTASPSGAGLAAELAAELTAALAPGGAAPRVYSVEPIGAYEDDPNVTDKKFPGNPTRSYRSREPLRVVEEVTDWERLSPEALRAWRERLIALRPDERGEIVN